MAILATQKVLTYDYWKPAAKLKEGDYVFNKDGKLTKIKLVQQYYSDECYEIMFDDYLTIAGDKHLGFLIEDKKYRKRLDEYKGIQKRFRRPLRFTKVDNLKDLPLKDKRNRSAYSIPTTQPIQLPHQPLAIPAFIFGFWFFNRNHKQVMLSPKGLSAYIYNQFKDAGYKIHEGKHGANGERYFTVTPTIESQLAPYVPREIPDNYMLGSSEDRLKLLSGIMHAKSRQYSTKRDMFRFSSKHYGTIKQIQGLVESLGNKSSVLSDDYKKDYAIFFRTKSRIMEHQISPPVKVHYGRRYIKEINPIKSQMCIHIETHDDDNSILVGEGFIQAC